MSKLNFDALRENGALIFNHGTPQELTEAVRRQVAADSAALITEPNAGIPALMSTYVDPEVVRVLMTPLRAAETFGEAQKGTWVDTTLLFPMAESTGDVSTYGDFSSNGMADFNANWVERQPYHYQVIVEIGDLEAARYGAARLNLVTEKQTSAAIALNRFQNKTYLFGVAGLKNYGALNDPSLLPALPMTTWAAGDGQVVFDSLLKLYNQLVAQSDGLVDRSMRMKLVLDPEAEAALARTNMYGLNVEDLLKKNFPNTTVHVIPEYKTEAGHNIQWVAEDMDGVQTVMPCFTEKMRVHRVENLTSAWRQKRSQGTNGSVIRRPFLISSGLLAGV